MKFVKKHSTRAEVVRSRLKKQRLGLVYPGITATDFIKHAASVHMSNDRQQIMQIESPEQVAEKIAEAIRTEAAEVSAESLMSRE